jgi:sugar phosphate permease
MGGMIAGLVGPTAAIAFGWQAVLWSAAACSVMAAAAAQPGRAVLDRRRGSASGPTSLPWRALASVVTTPSLRWIALSSLCFSSIQMCVVAFLVVLLVEDLHYDLVTAGVILGMVQIAGALGRIVWGYVADMVHDGLGVLLGLALIMTAAAAVVAVGGAGLPAWVSIATFILLGASAVGWNGVYMSEVARLSPAKSVGATTGASLFFTFSGVLIGPTLFSSIHAVIGSYLASYALLVGIGLVSAAMVAAVRFR